MLHVCVHAVVLGSFDSVGGDISRENGVFGIVFEVASRESCPVVVHRWRVPAGDIHFIGHHADTVTEQVRQSLVPCRRYDDAHGEADRADAGEIVVDGSRAVAIVGADLAYAVDGVGLVTAKGDECVHVVKRHLVHQKVPLGIILGKAAHVGERETARSAGRHRRRVRIFIRCRRFRGQVIADVEERSLGFFGHLEACGSGCRFRVVGKAVRAGQVSHVACCVVKYVRSRDQVAGALVLAVIDLCFRNREHSGVKDIVAVAADGDHIIARFQNIAFRVPVVIGHELFLAYRDLHGLVGARFQHSGLGELHKIRRRLLDAAVRVGRIAVHFHDLFSCHVPCIRDPDREGNGITVVCDIAHPLAEGRVGQAVAEGILHDIVVLDESLRRSGLIEAVADIDPFRIVHERGDRSGFRACKTDGCVGKIIHVGVIEVAEIVPPGSLFEVIHKGIHCFGRGVDFAGDDLSERSHADVPAGSRPDEALDLRVLLHKSELKCVGAVVNDDDIVKRRTDQIDHFLLSVVQLQIVVARVPVITFVEGVVVACRRVGRAVLIGAFDDRLHVRRKVGAFSARTGDHDHGGIGEGLRVRHKVSRIGFDVRFGQRPVLDPHADHRAVRLVLRIEPAEFGVRLNAGIRKTLEKVYRRIRLVERAGTAAAQHGVRGGPSEHIELGAFRQGKEAVLVLKEYRAFLCDLHSQLRGVLGSLF